MDKDEFWFLLSQEKSCDNCKHSMGYQAFSYSHHHDNPEYIHTVCRVHFPPIDVCNINVNVSNDAECLWEWNEVSD